MHTSIVSAFAFLWTACELAASASHQPAPAPAARLLYQFAPKTWAENIAVRPNGNILPALNTLAILQEYDIKSGELRDIYDFSHAGNAIQGIVEVIPDVFAVDVLTCDIVGDQTCTPGTGSTWRVDLRGSVLGLTPEVDLIAKFPQAGLLNCMATLSPKDGTIIMADSLNGEIWYANIWTKQSGLLFSDESLLPTTGIPTDVNGIRVRPGELYFTNSAYGTFDKISIDPRTGIKRRKATVIASSLSGPDDLEVDLARGVAYVCDGVGGRLLAISLDTGDVSVVAALPGPTSARWDRHDPHSLIVSTSGGLAQYLDHNVTLGGAIYRIDTWSEMGW